MTVEQADARNAQQLLTFLEYRTPPNTLTISIDELACQLSSSEAETRALIRRMIALNVLSVDVNTDHIDWTTPFACTVEWREIVDRALLRALIDRPP